MKLSTYLTVVIPCKNEEKLILKTLKSLNDQSGTKDLKVIIADCSSDNTRNSIVSYKLDPSNHLDIHITKGGIPSAARNIGASMTKTEFVLFLDADMWFVDHCHLHRELKLLRDKNLDLLTCGIRTNSFFYSFTYFIFEIFQRIISKKEPFAVGGYMFFRKSAFDRIGTFNEKDLFAEDFSLSRKIEPHKFKITNRIIKTSPRRLKSKGIFWMASIMIKTWFKRNQSSHYKKDHGYWN